MRQKDGVISEAIYYDVVRMSYAHCLPAPTKQMLLYYVYVNCKGLFKGLITLSESWL